MNYRSFPDLDACIARNLWKLPSETGLIVGVPRSGLLAANMLALHLNLPLADLDGFLQGRLLSSGPRLAVDRLSSLADRRTIAIVDDSVSSGQAMRRVRAKIRAAGIDNKIVYVAIYALDSALQEVDIHFELCPQPRVFAWNLMHRPLLANSCVDIDGVLCVDPSDEENDDGPRYLHFVETARPLLRPTYEIGTLVTCRLEKYRSQTEAWLARHGIRYRELVMWNLPNRQARLASAGHGAFKAEAYRARPQAELFIESSARQAQAIADLAFKPVLCVETQNMHLPGHRALLKGTFTNSPKWLKRGAQKSWSLIRDCMLRMSRCS